jgi:hypothetical protein
LIVGTSTDGSNVYHGFVYNGSSFKTIDAPGAGTGAFQGTQVLGINPGGTWLVGDYSDSGNVGHGFIYQMATSTFAVIDEPSAATGAYQGTALWSINDGGASVGQYVDGSNVLHGFKRSAGGTFVEYTDPNAGTGAFQGTNVLGINNAGNMSGFFTDSSGRDHAFVMPAGS